MKSPAALTNSSWLNAWSLRQACAAEGVALFTRDATQGLPVPPLPAGQPVQWLLPTDEAALREALQGADAARCVPAAFPASLLDDKWAFTAWLAERTGGPQALPQWTLDADPPPPYPLLLKARHSWVAGRKLPRGWVCRSAADLRQRRAELAALGLREEWFFLQAWAGDRPLKLLSVGGYFDARAPQRELLLLTERLLDDRTDGPGSSAMLATCPMREDLAGACRAVLAGLAYRGPFELEFIEQGGRLWVLELNPRLWMQHGLYLQWGNGLLRRCLGRDTEADHALARGAAPPLLWVDGTWLLRRLLRGPWAALSALWRHGRAQRRRVVVCPPLMLALQIPLRRWWARRGALLQPAESRGG